MCIRSEPDTNSSFRNYEILTHSPLYGRRAGGKEYPFDPPRTSLDLTSTRLFDSALSRDSHRLPQTRLTTTYQTSHPQGKNPRSRIITAIMRTYDDTFSGEKIYPGKVLTVPNPPPSTTLSSGRGRTKCTHSTATNFHSFVPLLPI